MLPWHISIPCSGGLYSRGGGQPPVQSITVVGPSSAGIGRSERSRTSSDRSSSHRELPVSFLQKQKNDHVLWRCTKRSNTINCPATIIQDGDDYRPGQKQHIHAGDSGSHIALRIKAEVKQQAKQAKFEERISSIVVKAITTHGDKSAPAGSRPNPGYLVRTANRVR
eukprot:XP_011418061.1 PREDICTED: uncharacterized protein LOC105321483 [Crassostrea gigas]